MATVTELAEALRAVVDAGLTDVDQSSVGSYTPALATEKIGLIIPPFRQREEGEWLDLSGTVLAVTHEIPLELWTKFTNDPTSLATCMQRARNVGLEAMRVIATGDGTGYVLAMEPPLFRLEVDDSFLEVNGNIFLRSRLTVRVYNEVSV